MRDLVGLADEVTVAVPEQAILPKNPCYKCSKETLEHTYEIDEFTHRPGACITRICSSPTCRAIQ